MANLKMIAKEAGVSVMTVSNVINGKHSKVSEATRSRIEDIIKKYNYLPNQNARSLVGSKSKMIGLIISHVKDENTSYYKNPFYSDLIGIVESLLRSKGYFLLIKSVETIEEITNVFKSWNVDGAILVGIFEDELQCIKKEIDIPLVCIDTFTTAQDILNVNSDDNFGGYISTSYLVQNGHKEIAFVSPKIQGDGVVRERYEGYKRALKESDILTGNAIEVSDCTLKEGKQVAKLVVASKVTAVCTTADILAIGLISGLKELGINVPQDISIIGYDNLEIGEFMVPQLTTIDQQLDVKVKRMVQYLMQLINNQQAEQASEELVKPFIIERESVRNLI